MKIQLSALFLMLCTTPLLAAEPCNCPPITASAKKAPATLVHKVSTAPVIRNKAVASVKKKTTALPATGKVNTMPGSMLPAGAIIPSGAILKGGATLPTGQVSVSAIPANGGNSPKKSDEPAYTIRDNDRWQFYSYP